MNWFGAFQFIRGSRVAGSFVRSLLAVVLLFFAAGNVSLMTVASIRGPLYGQIMTWSAWAIGTLAVFLASFLLFLEADALS